MLNRIFAFVAALGLIAPTVAYSQTEVAAPANVPLTVVQLGSILAKENGRGLVMMSGEGKSYTAVITNCIAQWNNGDEFYLFAVGSNGYVVSRKLFDALYATNPNFNVVANFLNSRGHVCQVLSIREAPTA